MSSVEKSLPGAMVSDSVDINGDKGKAEDLQKPGKKTDEKPTKELKAMNKKELLEELKVAKERSQENYDLYMRTFAEMENIKKRGQKERDDLAKYANESLIKEMLPVIDNLEQAISHSKDDANCTGLLEGIELTRSGLMSTLQRAGLQVVEAVGKPFDPNFHEAILQQEDDNVAPGNVITEFQKGYLLNGRLIRPSMVVVSQKKGNNQ